MQDRVVIVSDALPLRNLASDDDSELKQAQLLFEYLSYRQFSRKLITISKIFKKLAEKCAVNPELHAYFNNYYEAGEYIGTSESNTDAQEFFSLLENLSLRFHLVILLTENDALRNSEQIKELKRVKVMNFAQLTAYLNAKPDFYEYIFRKFYDRTQ